MLVLIGVVDRFVELWVLDEGSCASWRWNKRYDIGRSPDTFATLTVWRNNIVSKDAEDVLCLRDFLTNEVKRSSIADPGRLTGCHYYVESLVSVGNCYNEEASP